MKRARLAKEIIKSQCVRWYRKHGNSCEFSVWKLIRLVNGALGRAEINAKDVEIAKHYVSKIQHDLDVIVGVV